MIQWMTLGDSRFEVLTEGERYRGLGVISINGIAVRSGRLPLVPATQSFPAGLEFSEFRLLRIEQSAEEARLRLAVSFREPLTKLMRDHSFDPIYDMGDWGESGVGEAKAELDLVLRPASETYNGALFGGFSYHYEYRSESTPLFFILDRASWELDGEITGATAYSQSACSSPVATFEADTAWSTEGVIFFDEEATRQNPVMTHNLPRWASHGSFDFQFKGDTTLIGVFERVGLIRSVLQREAGRGELKTFDKHIFDASTAFATTAKKILLNTEPKTVTGQRNLWTWIMDEVHEGARAEFGLQEEAVTPRLSHNFWQKFTVESYDEDLIPAAAKMGVKHIFVDNLNKSDLTFGSPTLSGGNMCCGHEYELAPSLGGVDGVKAFVERCRAQGIEPYSWTNNDQSYDSPLHKDPRFKEGFVKMEDARLKYGGAYTNEFAIWDFTREAPRTYWIEALKQNKAVSGLSGYLFDSFYNLGFMPVSFSDMKPTTMWRELLGAFKELQDAGVHFLIESFGPFGQVQHGCPKSYNMENLFACYRIGMGNGYTTVPTGNGDVMPLESAPGLYRILAHMTNPILPLFVDGVRIDALWTAEHRQALDDYHTARDGMHRRYLQEDGASVLWHDAAGETATLWNFANRDVQLPGEVCDATTGETLPRAERYVLEACHTYVITRAALPTVVTAGVGDRGGTGVSS